MAYRTIIYEEKESIGWITLHRPEAANTINSRMTEEIIGACRRIAQNETIKVVIIRGAGETFSSGEDFAQLAESLQGKLFSPDQLKDFITRPGAAQAIASLECPVIAAINGDALGQGLELALACDLRIASEAAHFAFPHTSWGLIPRDGGTQRLSRVIGRAKALEMVLTADPIDAQEAFRIGLVHRILTPQEVIPRVEKMAEKMASGAPVALRYVKEAVHKGLDLTLEQGLRLECDLYMLLQTTHDRTEGIRAFLEKRKPQFKGE